MILFTSPEHQRHFYWLFVSDYISPPSSYRTLISNHISATTTMASNYTVPTRIESIFGSGGRRRPASSTVGPPDLRAEAWAIPHGEGGNLDDRQLMILCYLSPMERHSKFLLPFTGHSSQLLATLYESYLAELLQTRACLIGIYPARRMVHKVQIYDHQGRQLSRHVFHASSRCPALVRRPTSLSQRRTNPTGGSRSCQETCWCWSPNTQIQG